MDDQQPLGQTYMELWTRYCDEKDAAERRYDGPIPIGVKQRLAALYTEVIAAQHREGLK